MPEAAATGSGQPGAAHRTEVWEAGDQGVTASYRRGAGICHHGHGSIAPWKMGSVAIF